MAKRTSATTERSGGELATRARRGSARVAQETLPGLTPNEPQRAPARRAPGRAQKVEVALQLAPTNGNGPRRPARQQPESAPDAVEVVEVVEASPATPAQPRQQQKPGGKRFRDLRAAMADGWEIVQPIFARPLWRTADDSEMAYNFVLRREQSISLMTIPGARTVERFIESHGLQVDYRR